MPTVHAFRARSSSTPVTEEPDRPIDPKAAIDEIVRDLVAHTLSEDSVTYLEDREQEPGE